MNLKDFVKNVLVDLDTAVNEARTLTQRDIAFTQNSDNRTVEFDIAVTVEEKDSKEGKAGVRVLQFAEGGGSLANEKKNMTASRVTFGVRVDSMTREEQEEEAREIRRINSERSRSSFHV